MNTKVLRDGFVPIGSVDGGHFSSEREHANKIMNTTPDPDWPTMRGRVVIGCFGIPKIILSSNGPQFTSREFAAFRAQNGIQHKCSPPYHPATNGQVERMVQELKTSLKYRDLGVSVSTQVSHFLFSYRNTPHSTTQKTSASLLLKQLPTTRLSLLKPNFGRQQRAYQDNSAWPSRKFSPADPVDCV